MINEADFLPGIIDKYPSVLLEQRKTLEGQVLGCICLDTSLLEEHKLERKDFVTKHGECMFDLAYNLYKEFHVKVLDETSVNLHASPSQKSFLNEIGGYRQIRSLMQGTESKNASIYFDSLAKSNYYLRLVDVGISVTTPVEYSTGHGLVKRSAFEVCRTFNCQETCEWFDLMISRISREEGCESKILESKDDFYITDDIIESLADGSTVGVEFGHFGPYDDGRPDVVESDDERAGSMINTLPFLSRQIGGFRKGTTNCLCGYSSSGKTMLMCEILLGLISNGESVHILSNEMSFIAYYLNFIAFLAYRKFRCPNLTRSRLQSGNMSQAEMDVLKKIQRYFNERFAPYIKFDHISDADMATAKKLIRKRALDDGTTVVFYDTMKADIGDYKTSKQDPVYLTLIRDSRVLDEMAKRYNLIVLTSIQISSSTKGRIWLDEGCISNSKQIIEIMETCLMLRNCYGAEELEQGKKAYLNPFRKKPTPEGDWRDENMLFEPNTNYSVLFITKNRSGESSERTGEALLLQADTKHACFHEDGWVRPSRGWIGVGQGH